MWRRNSGRLSARALSAAIGFGAYSRIAGDVEPASQDQTIGGIEEDVDHDRVLQVSGYVAD
jgi:hypothetical protein